MHLTVDQYRQLRDFIYEQAGIALGEGKQSLINARLHSRLRHLGLEDFRQYLDYVREDRSAMEVVQLLDCISTNFTSFFREPRHFDVLAELVVEAAKAGQRRLRIWSAAASTGEEPYSIAMVVQHALEERGREDLDWRILASDISTRVLAACKAGSYDQGVRRAIPLQYHRYLHEAEGGGRFQVDDSLRRRLVIRRLNLSRPPFPMKGPMDVIFCRNVLIYFDDPVREALFREARRLLRPGGYFFIGLSESLSGLQHGLEYVSPSVYRREAD